VRVNTRRQFLKTAGLVTLGACAGPAAGLKGGFIDAHVHVWTPDLERYPLAQGFTREQMKPPRFTPEELFDHARPAGVERIVLIQMSFYRFDNAYMLDTIKRFPGVFSGVGIVDDSAPDVADRMRHLALRGVRGFRINPGSRKVDEWIGSEGMRTMWQFGAQSGLAICPLINPSVLPAIDRMCARHPDTPVVIDHFARVGVDGTIREEELAALCGLAKHRKTHVKTSAFYALGKKAAPYLDLGPMIRRVLDAFGPERLMWASDAPFQVVGGHAYAPSVELIRDRLDFLSESDRLWLLRGTAERVFFA
jgi:predicted TIM-barrel fold metal-dependent hydrolase